MADVLAYTRGAPDCDLILASFSLHHLDTAAKGDLLKAAYQRLVRPVQCRAVTAEQWRQGPWARCLPAVPAGAIKRGCGLDFGTAVGICVVGCPVLLFPSRLVTRAHVRGYHDSGSFAR